jgi:predicted CoA-binding protein
MDEHISCEMPDHNPPDENMRKLLETSRTIAVVGLSDNPERDSFRVAKYLIDQGYDVIPVNPAKSEILGRKSYPNLAEIPKPVDIVDVFRKIDAVPGVVDDAIAINARAVWLQLGLAHHESAEKARKEGLNVVQGKCIKVEHRRLFG